MHHIFDLNLRDFDERLGCLGVKRNSLLARTVEVSQKFIEALQKRGLSARFERGGNYRGVPIYLGIDADPEKFSKERISAIIREESRGTALNYHDNTHQPIAINNEVISREPIEKILPFRERLLGLYFSARDGKITREDFWKRSEEAYKDSINR